MTAVEAPFVGGDVPYEGVAERRALDCNRAVLPSTVRAVGNPKEHDDMSRNTRWHAGLAALVFAISFAAACGGPDSQAGNASPAASEGAGDAPAGAGSSPAADGRLAPLLTGLGEQTHAITTSEPQAQRYFDQGLVMHYAFNNAEARRAFQEAQRLDPNCAMCFWGEALTIGPGVNGGMDDADVPAAWAALQRAAELAEGATPVEQALIAALTTRYSPEPGADRSALDLDYAAAMARVAEEFPEDSDAVTLWAEAQMVSSPWDYWTEDGEPKEGFGDVLGILGRALESDPGNPGANHYYIHAVEAQRPELALDAARRLETLVPNAGHLVHMPAHIYLRLGMYHEATVINERAMAADEAYERESNQQGVYPLMYMPHNPHFLCYTAAMEGRGDYALEVARAMAERIEAEGGLDTGVGTVQHYWVTPLYLMVRFGRWDELLVVPEPRQDLPYPRGVWHYARGMSLLRRGDVAGSGEELARLRAIADDPAVAEATVWELNTADALLGIATRVLAGELAAAGGDYDAAIDDLRAAIDIESTLTYDEPPPWHQPVRHVLGAVLLDAGRPADAEAVYLEDLVQFPENGWSLLGLALSLEQQGKAEEAVMARQRFESAWENAEVELSGSRF